MTLSLRDGGILHHIYKDTNFNDLISSDIGV